jgi:hypothetical protein
MFDRMLIFGVVKASKSSTKLDVHTVTSMDNGVDNANWMHLPKTNLIKELHNHEISN